MKGDQAKTAVIYTRVSTHHQADKELPLESQLDQCREKARSLGAEVVAVFTDKGKSGSSDKKRSEFQQALAFCESVAPDYFICWNTSRFARNRLDAQLNKRRLAQAGTQLHYVSVSIDHDTSAGLLHEGILELFDEYMTHQVATDTRRSMVQNAKQGYFNGGRPPYGYDSVPAPDNPKKKVLIINEAEARVCRRIFKLKLEGLGGHSIATLLKSEGHIYRDRPWTRRSICNLLRNERVAGLLAFGKTRAGIKVPREEWVIAESHEPVISRADFEAVQSIMDNELTDNRVAHNTTYAFAGLLECGACGSRMLIERAKGRSKTYSYYNCGAAAKGTGCRHRRLHADELDRWLLDTVVTRIVSPRNIRELSSDLKTLRKKWAQDVGKQKQVLTTELQTKKTANERLYSLLESSSDFDVSDIAPRLKENNRQIEQLQHELNELDRRQPPQPVEDEKELCSILKDVVMEADARVVRTFLGHVIDKVIVGEKTIEVAYRPELLLTAERFIASDLVGLPGLEPRTCRL